MDAPLLLSVNLDLNLSCRGGGLAIFAGLSEIGDFRQAKAENFTKNYLLLESSKVILHLHNAFELVKQYFSGG